MEHEDDDRRGKRKMVESRDKDSPCHGCGRLAAASSGAALRGRGDRGGMSSTSKMRKGWR